jgi:hypothetical protein
VAEIHVTDYFVRLGAGCALPPESSPLPTLARPPLSLDQYNVLVSNPHELPFEALRERLDSLLTATANKLEREFPGHIENGRDLGGLLRCFVLVAQNTYMTMRYFCADKPSDPARKPAYVLSGGPLARTVLDQLFTVVFLLEDLQERAAWYEKAGWRELKEFNVKAHRDYGADPSWKGYLVEHDALVARAIGWWGVTPEEEADPKKLKYWPLPSQMIKLASTDQARSYLRFLDDWFYRELSQDTHLSWPGLMRRTGFLLIARPTDQDFARLAKQKSDIMVTTIIMLLALLSEIELALHFTLAERLKYLWALINGINAASLEIFNTRYHALL